MDQTSQRKPSTWNTLYFPPSKKQTRKDTKREQYEGLIFSDARIEHSSDSYSAAISHLKDVPTFDESTVRLGQSYNAPSTISNNNRVNNIQKSI